MIYHLVKANNTQTISSFLNTWGRKLCKRVKIIPYEKLARKKTISQGTYILSDLDLLNEKQLFCIKTIIDQAKKYPESFRILNEPFVSLDRIQLLNRLNECDINSFRCYPLTQKPKNVNFPVFIRKGKGHKGKLSELIIDEYELEAKLNEAKNEGLQEDDIIITEFIETADENRIYRKYSAFIIDGTIVPRHIFFSKRWMVKGARLTEQHMIDEELEYIKNNPHGKFLKKVFEIAGIRYGRVDYSLRNGRPVIWEINSNPMIASSSSLKKPQREMIHKLFTTQFINVINELDIQLRKKRLPNPLNYSDSGSENSKQIFPFRRFEYLTSSSYKTTKYTFLYYFYLARNRIMKKDGKNSNQEN